MARVKSSEEDVYYRNDPMKSAVHAEVSNIINIEAMGPQSKGAGLNSQSRHEGKREKVWREPKQLFVRKIPAPRGCIPFRFSARLTWVHHVKL